MILKAIMTPLLCTSYTSYSGPLDIRTPDIRTLQYPDDFSWEQIFKALFCLIYPEFHVPDPDGLFLPQNAFLVIFCLSYPDGRF